MPDGVPLSPRSVSAGAAVEVAGADAPSDHGPDAGETRPKRCFPHGQRPAAAARNLKSLPQPKAPQ